MKKRLIIGMLAVALAVGGVGAGATAGKLMPTMGQLFGVTAAGAASLSVEAIAPLAPLTPTGSGFTYQGRLKDRATPADGQYDFEFSLYDDLTRGTLVADPVRHYDQAVSEGLFTVLLDFGGSPFNGDARYLEIAVRPVGEEEYTILAPRQPITPAPYALYALKTKGYKNVVTVSPEGGDFTTITAALNSITTNSSTNKYLVWVGPGTYTETVTMKQWVDIEGAGELTTKITFTGSDDSNTGTVVGASNAELRSLTVENTGGNTYAIAIFNSAASPSLLHVTATASGGNYNLGVYNFDSSPSMNNVTATASSGSTNYGVLNEFSSSPSMINVTATASGGAINYGVYNDTSSPSMNNVTATASGGTNNYGVYNDTSSPSMNNVTATASGGTSINYGVYDNSSSPSMNNVTATASGGTNNFGVYNYSSSPSMNNVTATASGGTYSYGVYNYYSSPSMNNVTATASGGTFNYGVFNTGSGTTTINNSVITGTNTVSTNGGTVKVGASKLNGGPVLGPVTCAGVYDENYVFFPSTCP